MSAQRPTPVFYLKGASTRALQEAFTRLQAAIRFDQIAAPMWAPEDGFAGLGTKGYRLQLYLWRAVNDPKEQWFSVACYGMLPDDDKRVIVGALQEPPLPMGR